MAKQRVHEIAKTLGLESKQVVAALKEAGVEVKTASSSVDQQVALKALADAGALPTKAADGNGSDGAPAAKPAPAPAAKAEPAAPAAKPAPAAPAPAAK